MKQAGRAGAVRERMVREHFRQRGFIAIKVSDSAICDVVAMRCVDHDDTVVHVADPPVWMHRNRPVRREMPGSVTLMIEVKGSARSPFADFCPADRVALIEAAQQAGATPLLAWWPPRGELRLYGVDEWPESQKRAA